VSRPLPTVREPAQRPQVEFMPVEEIAARSGFKAKSLYNQFSEQRGALIPILTKFGGRLGAWREDWETFKASQRKLSA
jgi:hypothetical protein